MNRTCFIGIILLVFLFPSLIHAERGIRVKKNLMRIALVIGNGAYKSAPLKNPVNDAQDMAAVLTNLGFQVIHKTNAARRAMVLAVNEFGRKLRKADVGLFYYAGHGMQIEGRNYLIPIGANVVDEQDVEFEGVDAGRILGKMEAAGNTVNIVFLDACRDNPFSRSFRTGSRGLLRMNAPKGSFIAYATEPGNVAADGRGRNSPFTKHLLKHIKTPGLKIEDVLKRVRADVTSETGDKQLPWQSSSLVGDFYFVVEGKVTVTKRPKTESSMALERESLEDERQELERLKMEIERKKLEAERERLKAEKERLEVASVPTKPSHTAPASYANGAEVSRDGVYIAYANGVVRDTKTGFEWVAGPDRDMTWDEANQWVQSLNIAGGGWRMPTLDELESLYKKGLGNRNMTLLLKNTAWYVWSVETQDSSSAWTFSFEHGYMTWDARNFHRGERAFAVRSRSD